MAIESASGVQMQLPVQSKKERVNKYLSLRAEIKDLRKAEEIHKNKMNAYKNDIKAKEKESEDLLELIRNEKQLIYYSPAMEEEAEGAGNPDGYPSENELNKADTEENGSDEGQPEQPGPITIQEISEQIGIDVKNISRLVKNELSFNRAGAKTPLTEEQADFVRGFYSDSKNEPEPSDKPEGTDENNKEQENTEDDSELSRRPHTEDEGAA